MNKNSKQRNLISKILQDANCHPTADWIYEQARKEMPNISLGTVYRNLKLLQADGKVRELAFEKGMSRYDGELGEHYHVRCSECGKIDDIHYIFPQESLDEIQQKTGYRVYKQQMTFIGICPECYHKREHENKP